MKKFKRVICLSVIALIAISFMGDQLIGWGEACSAADRCRDVVFRVCEMACKGGGNECTGIEWWGQCQNGICVIEATCFCKIGEPKDYVIFCPEAPCPK